MKIIVTTSSSKQQINIPKLLQEEAKAIHILGLSVHQAKLNDKFLTDELSGMILCVFDDREYRQSLALIRERLEPNHVPYLCVLANHVNFDLDQTGSFFPDQVLVDTSGLKTIRNAIQLFLLKIKQGYFEIEFEQGSRKRIWLLLKRGVYQSLETDEIKYIEAADHYIKIHSERQRILLIKISLTEFYKKYLTRKGHFYPLNRSFVINAKKVIKIENNKLYIDENRPLSIPRKKRTEVLDFVGINPER